MNEAACAGAAFGGHLETLRWLRQNGCPWDEKTCLDAARQGHLRVFEWALKEGAPDGIWSDSESLERDVIG